jgi:hypothetical protein
VNQAKLFGDREKLLRALAEECGGNSNALINAFATGRRVGLTDQETDGALGYLEGRGLLEGWPNGEATVTISGVDAVETNRFPWSNAMAPLIGREPAPRKHAPRASKLKGGVGGG